MNFKFQIGEAVWVYFTDDYEKTQVQDRKSENGLNYYLTEWGWQGEGFLRKND